MAITASFYCTFEQALNARGSHTVINYCTLNGALNVSGDDVVVNGGSISDKITVNNGACLNLSETAVNTARRL